MEGPLKKHKGRLAWYITHDRQSLWTTEESLERDFCIRRILPWMLLAQHLRIPKDLCKLVASKIPRDYEENPLQKYISEHAESDWRDIDPEVYIQLDEYDADLLRRPFSNNIRASILNFTSHDITPAYLVEDIYCTFSYPHVVKTFRTLPVIQIKLRGT
jgi:hypothetical protein